MARTSLIPRSFWYLMIAVVLAGGWLLIGPGEEDGQPPLVPLAADEVVSLTVGDAESSYGLMRTPEGWRLDGDCPDHLSDADVNSLLDDLVTVRRSAEPVASDDLGGSFGLTDARALVLTIVDLRGVRCELTIGGVNEVTGTAYVRETGKREVFLTAGEVRGWLLGVPNALRDDEVWPDFREDQADTLELVAGVDTHLFARDDLGRWWLRDDGRAGTGPSFEYRLRSDDRTLESGGARWHRADDRALRNLVVSLVDARVNVFHRPGRRAQPAPIGGRSIRTASRGGSGHDLVFGDIKDTFFDAWRDDCPCGLVMSLDGQRAAEAVTISPLREEVLTHGLALADSFVLELTGWPQLTVVRRDDGWAQADRDATDRDLRNQIRDMAVLLDRLPILSVRPTEHDPDQLFADGYRLTLRTWHSRPGLPQEQVMVFGVSREKDRLLGWRPSDGFVCEVPREVMTSSRALISGLR